MDLLNDFALRIHVRFLECLKRRKYACQMAVESELMLTEYFLAAADVLEGQFQRRANKYVRLLLCNFLHKTSNEYLTVPYNMMKYYMQADVLLF